MAQTVFFKSRAWELEETIDGPRVVIKSPFLWPLTIFLGFWLAGWTAGEVSAIKSLWQLANSATGWLALLPGAFLLFWLAGWTLAGVFIWGIFLFSIKGREVISLRGDKLRIRLVTLLGLGWSRDFSLSGMEPPRLMVMPLPQNKNLSDAQAAGAVLPKYSGITISGGGRSWRVGIGLDEAGAKDLLYTLTARFCLPKAGEPEIQKGEDFSS